MCLHVFPVFGGGDHIDGRCEACLPRGCAACTSPAAGEGPSCSELTRRVLFVLVYSHRYAVASHCGFIWISLTTEDVVHFSCAYLLFMYPVWGNICSNHLASFFLLLLPFCHWNLRVHCLFWTLLIYSICFANIFSQYIACPFVFLIVSFKTLEFLISVNSMFYVQCCRCYPKEPTAGFEVM